MQYDGVRAYAARAGPDVILDFCNARLTRVEFRIGLSGGTADHPA